MLESKISLDLRSFPIFSICSLYFTADDFSFVFSSTSFLLSISKSSAAVLFFASADFQYSASFSSSEFLSSSNPNFSLSSAISYPFSFIFSSNAVISFLAASLSATTSSKYAIKFMTCGRAWSDSTITERGSPSSLIRFPDAICSTPLFFKIFYLCGFYNFDGLLYKCIDSNRT